MTPEQCKELERIIRIQEKWVKERLAIKGNDNETEAMLKGAKLIVDELVKILEED